MMRSLLLIFIGLWLIGMFYAWSQKLTKDFPVWAVSLGIAFVVLPLAIGVWSLLLGIRMIA